MLPHEWVSFLEEANIYWSDVWRGMQADDYIVKIEEYVDNLINYTLLKKTLRWWWCKTTWPRLDSKHAEMDISDLGIGIDGELLSALPFSSCLEGSRGFAARQVTAGVAQRSRSSLALEATGWARGRTLTMHAGSHSTFSENSFLTQNKSGCCRGKSEGVFGGYYCEERRRNKTYWTWVRKKLCAVADF